jgi:hypothetical protein
VNAICEYQQQTFVGTSLGVFRFVTHRKATLVEKFEQLKGFNDQAFNVSTTPYGVLVASNTGSYLINQDLTIRAISPTPSFVHLVSKIVPSKSFCRFKRWNRNLGLQYDY